MIVVTETYATARMVFKGLSFFGWALCAVGVIGGLLAFDASGADGIVLLVASVFAGVITVALAQMGLAQIATAEAASAILAHLVGSEQTPEARKRHQDEPPRKAGIKWHQDEPPRKAGVRQAGGSRALAEVYKDRSIDRVDGGFEVDGWGFHTLEDARAYVDQN